jgi:hypothetical protein
VLAMIREVSKQAAHNNISLKVPLVSRKLSAKKAAKTNPANIITRRPWNYEHLQNSEISKQLPVIIGHAWRRNSQFPACCLFNG